jgi:uncharacterized membrane-anchored protein YhcB (DUF1043 family)
MYKALIQQAMEWQEAAVFIPLGFGLAVGLAYVIISAATKQRLNHQQQLHNQFSSQPTASETHQNQVSNIFQRKNLVSRK